MKVYYVTSEAAPFSKAGELGDMLGALPAAISKNNTEVRVVAPLYGNTPEELCKNLKFIKSIWVDLSYRHRSCGIFEAEYNGVTYLLLDNETYFKRPEMYGYCDDAERFAFLSKAAVDIIEADGIVFVPDVIHAYDWQTALVPVYLSLSCGSIAKASPIKTVFTILNIENQGQFPKEFMTDVFGIDMWNYYNGIMEHDGCVNLMKSAIGLSDYVTTVSPFFAKEIQLPTFGNGLDDILSDHKCKLEGILNGKDQCGWEDCAQKYLSLYRRITAL